MSTLPRLTRCYRCGKYIENEKAIALELNCATGSFHSAGVPPAESQGWFMFGPDCGPKSDGKQVSAHAKWASA